MSTAKITAAFQERLPLEEPELWDDEGLEGHDKMSVVRSNERLEVIFAEADTELPKLMASVRWSIFQLPYGKYAKELGMSTNGYRPMEEDTIDGRPHRVKYTKALEYWKNNDISPGIREQMLELLHGDKKDDIHAFWHKAGYELGHAEVEKTFPHFYNTLWQSERSGAVEKGVTFIEMMDTLYPQSKGRISPEDRVRNTLRHEQGEEVWKKTKIELFVRRGIELPLATMLAAMEWDIARYEGESMTASSLKKHYGFSPIKAKDITQCELVEWDIIQGLAEDLLDRETLQAVGKAWQQEEKKEQQRPSFKKLCAAALKGAGITPADIGRALDIGLPEERNTRHDAPERKERYRPDGIVRPVMYDNTSTALVPVDTVMHILSKESDVEFSELADTYTQERTRFYQRSGTTLHGKGLEMRLQRECAGVTMQQLAKHFTKKNASAAEIRKTDLELQRLERQEGGHHVITFGNVKKILQKISDTKSTKALDRLSHLDDIPEELYQWDSMTCMAKNLRRIHGSNIAVREVMEEAGGKLLRPNLVRKMGDGEYVPPLPVVRHMSESAGAQSISHEVVKDWYARFPEYLQERAEHPIENPLARMLTTLIRAKEDGTAKTFYDERYMGAARAHASQVLFQFQRYGEWPDWEFVESTLKAAGVYSGDPAHVAAGVLWDTDGDIPKAVSAARSVLQERGLETHPIHVPGLTQKELDSTKARRSSSNGNGRATTDFVNEHL